MLVVGYLLQSSLSVRQASMHEQRVDHPEANEDDH
jgi:hypothetical protein